MIQLWILKLKPYGNCLDPIEDFPSLLPGSLAGRYDEEFISCCNYFITLTYMTEKLSQLFFYEIRRLIFMDFAVILILI